MDLFGRKIKVSHNLYGFVKKAKHSFSISINVGTMHLFNRIKVTDSLKEFMACKDVFMDTLFKLAFGMKPHEMFAKFGGILDGTLQHCTHQTCRECLRFAMLWIL